MKIIKIQTGDILLMKKPHPCKSFKFEVLRTGSDIRVRCLGCSRDMNVPREKLEKKIKAVNDAPPSFINNEQKETGLNNEEQI